MDTKKEYTRDELWALYEKIPRTLQRWVFSPDVAERIESTRQRFELTEETGTKLAEQIRNVLLGIALLEDFQKNIEKYVGAKKEIAKQIAIEINRFVFYPMKAELAELHNATPSKPSITLPVEPEKTEDEIVPEKKSPAEVDQYREEIE